VNAPFASVTARDESIVTKAPAIGVPAGSFTTPWMFRKRRAAMIAFMEILSKKFFQEGADEDERCLVCRSLRRSQPGQVRRV